MVDPSSEDDGILREWAPLSPLLSQIPPKAQRGLFTGDLNLTCIAALPNYLAIGTNHGLVYWYNRSTNELQRLRCENTVCAITCIAVVSTVDYMIAAGTSTGVVSVFLVPKASPENIPEVFKNNSKKQVERYTVGGLHSASVSAIEWSLNGMKLFSGDQKGLVVLTEIDFYMHLSKSVEIFNEKYEVVQLSYNSSNQLLLVSTLYRTILCHKSPSDGVWKVSQVGNTERKTLGRMGATFCSNPENPRSPVAYCSRPGLRLWIANKEGIVEKTLMFKDSVHGHHHNIQLLNPTKSQARQSRGEPQLGPLLVFKDQLIVTYTADALLVLDPQSISVVAALYDVQRISALCVTKSEIFILEGERHLIRIGFAPQLTPTAAPIEDSASIGGPLANQILELTAKLRDTSITSIIPIKKLAPIFSPTKSSGSSDGEQISECMEAQELPPVVSLDSLDLGTAETLPELRVSAASFTTDKEVYTRAQRSMGASHSNASVHSELLDKIAQEQFEEVVFQPKKKTKKNRSKRGTATVTGTESGSDTTSMVSTTSENDEIWASERMDASSEWSSNSINNSRRSSVDTQSKQVENYSINPGMSIRQEGKVFEAPGKSSVERLDTFFTQSITESTQPTNLQSADSFLANTPNLECQNKDEIEQTVVTKELLVAKKYNLESVLGIAPEKVEAVDDAKLDGPHSETSDNSDLEINESKPDAKCTEDSEESTLRSVSAIDSLKSMPDGRGYFQDDGMTSMGSTLSYGPPSGSGQLPSRHASLDLELSSVKDKTANTALRREAMEASGWLQFNTPQPVVWVAVCSNYLAAIDANDSVHYCSLGGLGLRWQRADCKATQLALSPNNHCVWRLHNNVAYALKNPSTTGPHGEDWLEAATNVRSLAVGDNSAWLVTQDGGIFCQKDLTPDSPISEPIEVVKPCEWPPVKIVCFSQIVWLLSSTGEVYVRLGVSSAKPDGIDWKRVNIPVPGSVVDISLASQRTGWIVDNNDTVMFSVDHLEHDPHWWQVLISDYIFQQTSPLQRLRSKITLKNLRPALPGRQVPLSYVASGKDSVWIIQQNSNTLHVNKTKITGHSWTRIKLKGSPTGVRWQTVSAEGIFESGGQLWLLSANGDLYCSQPYNNKNLKKIPLPTTEGAVCLAASSQALWVLTSSGEIYIRQGLSDTCLEGSNWRQLSLMQIEGTHLTHVSCGLDVVWACDTKGSMYMTVSSPHAMATATFSPVWIRVPDTKEQKKIFFIKVFVGSQTYMVWALDNRGKIYVREAIFPDFPLGADWVAVTGITAVDLSVSASAVWALSVEGDVYRRHGITQNNYIGDYWKKIPGSVEALTASMCDRLWGTDKSGSLLRHNQLTVNLNPTSGTPAISQPVLSNVGEVGDWEVVDITNPVVM